jgi:DNA helicase-2/ATP-dependent DNA helicase PcrA
LNTAQKVAVETLRGPLLVLAGAGTGKTHTVTHRIARLIQSGIEPNRILAVTFTNKAAKEMQQRIGELLNGKQGSGYGKRERPETSTFHSLCVRILRRHIAKIGYPNQFAIYDRGDQESIARQVLHEFRISDASLRPGEFLAKISTWKNSGVSPEAACNNIFDPKDYLAARAFGRYQAAMKTVGAVDFDDLLILTEELFSKFPDVLQTESGRFDHILVDEYQDTNLCQYKIVKGLALPHRNLCVVGDDDQAIYGWRGAEVKHILNFTKDWRDAKVVRLEENYRSTKQILDWANRLIVFNKFRHDKKLMSPLNGEPPQILQCKDGEVEAKTVIAKINERITAGSVSPRNIAVLFRTNEQPRAFEMEFRAAKIPYTVVGTQSFFDKKEVRDIMAYLKVLNRPKDDVSLLRIVNTPPRGIGQTTVQKLTEQALKENKPVWEVIQSMTNDELRITEPLTSNVSDALNRFRRFIEQQRNVLCRNFTVENLKQFIGEIQYEKEINRLYPDENERKDRWDSIGEIINAAAEHVNNELWSFLDETSLAGPGFGSSKDKQKGANAITLMTLHAAKGLEFPEVFIVGMEEGILPHHRSVNNDDVYAVDEERRLCYVGLTRAKERLTLSLAMQRLKWGKMRPTIPSRFLYEITGQAENPNYKKVADK